MLVFDAHLDLAMNALHWNRNLELGVAEVRALESGMEQKGRAAGTVCFPEMLRGEVGICVATVIARVARPGNPMSGYAAPEIAYAVAQGQRAYYRALEARGCFHLIRNRAELEEHAWAWGVQIVDRPDGLTPGPPPTPWAPAQTAWRGGTELPPPGGSSVSGGNLPPGSAPPGSDVPSVTPLHAGALQGSGGEGPGVRRSGKPPIGVILSMEGADPILYPEQVEEWWEDGLRVIGPAHYGVSTYAHGTATPGGLTDQGPALLAAMERRGMILDVTHLADESFWQALERFGGRVLASHSNCRALVPGDRQFDDDQLRALIERDAVIGAAFDAWMLYPGWIKGETHNSVVSMEAVADQIDHVCQLAGNCRHAAIGTDLDGGYGQEQCPHDLDTIADLQKIPALLRRRGYSDADAAAVMHGNWLRLFQEAL